MQYTCVKCFTNSRKLKRLDCVSSFQTFPRTSKNHLPPLFRNILFQIKAACWLDVKFKERNSILGLEPEPLAFRANALPLSYPGQVRVHDKTNLLIHLILLQDRTCCVFIMSYGGMHSQTLE